MAKFSFNGIDELEISLEQLARLTDEDKWSILEAGANVLKAAQESKLLTLFRQHTGVLAASLKISRKNGDSGVVARIAPAGQHPGSSTGKRMKNTAKGRRSSGSYDGSNAEIAYILEYGSPRIAPRHWMETANEEADEERAAAMEAAWDELLKSKGL